MFEPSPSRGKVAPPKAVTDEGETNVPPALQRYVEQNSGGILFVWAGQWREFV